MDNWDSQLRNQHTQPPRTAAAAKPQTCKHVYEPNWGFFAAVSMRNGFPGSAHKVTWHLLVLFIRRVIWWRKRCESEFLARAEHTVSLLYRDICLVGVGFRFLGGTKERSTPSLRICFTVILSFPKLVLRFALNLRHPVRICFIESLQNLCSSMLSSNWSMLLLVKSTKFAGCMQSSIENHCFIIS